MINRHISCQVLFNKAVVISFGGNLGDDIGNDPSRGRPISMSL